MRGVIYVVAGILLTLLAVFTLGFIVGGGSSAISMGVLIPIIGCFVIADIGIMIYEKWHPRKPK